MKNKCISCLSCTYYWKDYGYREIIDNDDITIGYQEYSKFKHGCNYYNIKTSAYQSPADFVYRSIGRQCPLIDKPLKNNKKNNNTVITEDHIIDIIV
jgi:hypothetical protein